MVHRPIYSTDCNENNLQIFCSFVEFCLILIRLMVNGVHSVQKYFEVYMDYWSFDTVVLPYHFIFSVPITNDSNNYPKINKGLVRAASKPPVAQA
jgi:hypothetical protein